jgi:hypothetical protein
VTHGAAAAEAMQNNAAAAKFLISCNYVAAAAEVMQNNAAAAKLASQLVSLSAARSDSTPLSISAKAKSIAAEKSPIYNF